jgi:glycosyltransferase involved in cell wall biosynthesis
VKNHSTLIAAAGLLREKLPDAIYVIVGAGELEADLKAEIERANLGSWFAWWVCNWTSCPGSPPPTWD